VPLEAIGQILDARDPETTRKVLREHAIVLEERLATTQRAVDALYSALDVPASHTPVHLRHEPARSTLTISGRVQDAEPFLRRAAAVLDDAVRLSGAVANGGFGALFPTEIEDEDGEDVVAFIPIEAAHRLGEAAMAADVRVGELPATDVAVVMHHGSFESMVDTYRHLGAWVATNAEPANRPVREYYLDDLNTEICWPVY
jgi:effector-binding domain-containing protein